MLLEDGLSYVRDRSGSACNDPGGRTSMITVPARFVDQTIAAALDCPGECIFLEHGEAERSDDADIADADIVDAELVNPDSGA